MRPITITLALALACTVACGPERASEGTSDGAPAGDAAGTSGAAAPTPDAVRPSDSARPAGRRADRLPAPDVPAQPQDSLGPVGAVAVIRGYYDAIARRDYERAYRYWGGGGSASGQSFEAFARGFAETASVEVEIGEPGRIEAAAGSRYIEVPVAITAVTTGGEEQRFEGTYALRRAVVEGATAEQRAWHIYSADIARIE